MPIRDSNYEGRVLFIIYFLEKGSATRVAPASPERRVPKLKLRPDHFLL
jgi:hypothetical protein